MNMINKLLSSKKFSAITNKGICIILMAIIVFYSAGCKEKLTPEEWLEQWNQAWEECYYSLPPVRQNNTYIDPNEDLMEQLTFKPIINRDPEVEELLKVRYPELYEYRGIPEYENILQKQREKAEEIIRQMERANEEQKERMRKEGEEWLKQYNKSLLDAMK